MGAFLLSGFCLFSVSGFESSLCNTKGTYRDSARLKHQFNFVEIRLISLCFGTVLRMSSHKRDFYVDYARLRYPKLEEYSSRFSTAAQSLRAPFFCHRQRSLRGHPLAGVGARVRRISLASKKDTLQVSFLLGGERGIRRIFHTFHLLSLHVKTCYLFTIFQNLFVLIFYCCCVATKTNF